MNLYFDILITSVYGLFKYFNWMIIYKILLNNCYYSEELHSLGPPYARKSRTFQFQKSITWQSRYVRFPTFDEKKKDFYNDFFGFVRGEPAKIMISRMIIININNLYIYYNNKNIFIYFFLIKLKKKYFFFSYQLIINFNKN